MSLESNPSPKLSEIERVWQPAGTEIIPTGKIYEDLPSFIERPLIKAVAILNHNVSSLH